MSSMEAIKPCKYFLSSNGWMVVLLLSLFTTLSIVVVGVECGTKHARLVNPNTILKTIKSENGDVVDCVDIFKQPAFSHPLLGNHTLQTKPSPYTFGMKVKDSESYGETVVQTWHKNGEYCPEGTIPIARYQVASTHNKTHPSALLEDNIDAKNHEHAQVTMMGGNYYGGTAKFNLWNPLTNVPDLSLSQIWVLAGDGPHLNSIEAGWMVDGFKHNFYTRLFTFWTSDGYRSTGCYNLECGGFVQTSNKIGLGVAFTPMSTYGGNQFEITITIHKDMMSGNWWLQVQGENVGYWPSNLFNGSGLSTYSTVINWGGEITNTSPQGVHTQTDMGSGHFASEGWSKAAFIRKMGYVDEGGDIKDAHDLYPYATRPECYSVHVGEWDHFLGAHIFYGGPGYSPSCKTQNRE